MRSPAAAVMIALLLVAAGCGDSEDDAADTAATTTTTTASGGETAGGEAPEADGKGSGGFALVESCGEQTGQDIFAPPPGSPEFIACLEESGAPPDTIEAWAP